MLHTLCKVPTFRLHTLCKLQERPCNINQLYGPRLRLMHRREAWPFLRPLRGRGPPFNRRAFPEDWRVLCLGSLRGLSCGLRLPVLIL